ncbi:hypothetical protein PISMIDRAFT_77201, partial [Pisolithus microcarpus 441]
RSTCNSRIERLWVEVGMQFARHWRAFFTRLENQHMLNPHSPNHLWLLHLLFLDSINADCLNFQQEWNCHPISAVDDELSDDKEHAALEAQTAEHIKLQQQQHIHKGPVHVPSHQMPFTNPEDFFGVLQEVIGRGVVPNGFGLTPEEWEAGQYPIFETI